LFTNTEIVDGAVPFVDEVTSQPASADTDQFSVPPPVFEMVSGWPSGPPPPCGSLKLIAVTLSPIVGVGAVVKFATMVRFAFSMKS
jgi:hypothetical protein